MGGDHNFKSMRRRLVAVIARSLVIVMAILSCASSFAHGDALVPRPRNGLWKSWEFDPFVILGLFLSAALYSRGLYRLWHKTRFGGGVRPWEASAFAAGWLATVLALVSPLHPLGQILFSAHMTQHEVLMLVAAPLLVLGRPLIVFLWAFSHKEARQLSSWTRRPWFDRSWRLVSNAFAAWLIHMAALWLWHIPALFQATLESALVHALQHMSFLFSALLFWWAVLHGRQKALGYGLAVVYMFATALQSGLLGVLLTVSTRIWYPAYGNRAATWGLTPLEDQQLGGLIMWIPAGIVYIVAALALITGWLREAELRSANRERLNLKEA
jgi:putative membrane protein